MLGLSSPPPFVAAKFVRNIDGRPGSSILIPEGYIELELDEAIDIAIVEAGCMYYGFNGKWALTNECGRHDGAKYSHKSWRPMIKRIL